MSGARGSRRARVARPFGLHLLLAASLVAIPAERVEGQTEANWFFADVSFPAQVDTFQVVRSERWPQPERGTVLHYETALAPGASFDVHVQAMPAGRDAQEALREELQRTLGELARYGANGPATSSIVDTVRTVSVDAGGRTYEGHMAEATFRTGRVTGQTLAYVFIKPPSFVKFRITHSPGQWSMLEPRIEPFVRGILERIESFQDPSGPRGP